MMGGLACVLSILMQRIPADVGASAYLNNRTCSSTANEYF